MKHNRIEEALRELRHINWRLKFHVASLGLHVSFHRLNPPSVSPRHSSDTSAAAFSDSNQILFLQPTNLVTDYDLDKGVPVHRFVLVSRSPIFKEMLDNAGTNVPDEVFKIPDVSLQLLQLFVNFMYTGETGTILDEDTARSLFILGDKYNVELLKKICELYLCRIFSAENALIWLEFARQYRAKRLLLASKMKTINMSYLRKELAEVLPLFHDATSELLASGPDNREILEDPNVVPLELLSKSLEHYSADPLGMHALFGDF